MLHNIRLQGCTALLHVFFVRNGLGICTRTASLGISDGEPSSRNTMVGRYYIGTKMNIARTWVTRMPKVGLALPKDTTQLSPSP